MKYVIASDIHGSAYYCQKLVDFFENSGADKLVLLGDLLYHGARNPLPKEYDTLKVAELLNDRKQKIVCVRGNCDSEVDQMVLEFPILAEYAILQTESALLYLTHGHKTPVCLGEKDILVNGHFHVPACEQRQTCLYLNCGSVSIPKENSPHSCLVLEGDELKWYDLESGEIYLSKNIKNF